jgi:hypothetical protein
MKLMSPRNTAVGQTLDHRLRSHVGRRIDLRLDEKKASTFARGHPASFRDAPVLSSRRSFPEQQSMTVARMPKYQLLE